MQHNCILSNDIRLLNLSREPGNSVGMRCQQYLFYFRMGLWIGISHLRKYSLLKKDFLAMKYENMHALRQWMGKWKYLWATAAVAIVISIVLIPSVLTIHA